MSGESDDALDVGVRTHPPGHPTATSSTPDDPHWLGRIRQVPERPTNRGSSGADVREDGEDAAVVVGATAISSLPKMLRTWLSTVLGLRKSFWQMP